MAKSEKEKAALKAAKAAAKKSLREAEEKKSAGAKDEHIESASAGPVHPSAEGSEQIQGEHIRSAMNGPIHESDGSERKGMDIHGRKK